MLLEQLLNAKRLRKHVCIRRCATPHMHDTCMTKLRDTCSSPSPRSSRTSLCPRVLRTHTRTHLSATSGLQLYTPARSAGRVSFSNDEATYDQWAVVRTVRECGGNSPPITLLPTWEPKQPRGGAARPTTVWMNTKQKLSPTGELHESLLVFLYSILFFCFPPSPIILFFIQGWHAALHFGSTEKKDTEKQNSQSVGTFSPSFFLLPGAFISINSAYTGICAPVALN